MTTAVRELAVVVGDRRLEVAASPGARPTAVITTTSVVSGSVSARHCSSIPRLYGERIATSLRYGLVRLQALRRELVGLLLVELLEVLVVLGRRAQPAAVGVLADPEDDEEGRR